MEIRDHQFPASARPTTWLLAQIAVKRKDAGCRDGAAVVNPQQQEVLGIPPPRRIDPAHGDLGVSGVVSLPFGSNSYHFTDAIFSVIF